MQRKLIIGGKHMSTSTQYDYAVAMLSDRAMEIMTNNGGRGHNSYKEAYARMKAPIEDIEAFIKQIKKIHTDVWVAAKTNNEDEFAVLTKEIERMTSSLIAKAVDLAAITKIGIENPRGGYDD